MKFREPMTILDLRDRRRAKLGPPPEISDGMAPEKRLLADWLGEYLDERCGGYRATSTDAQTDAYWIVHDASELGLI